MEFFACAYAAVPCFALFSAPNSAFNLLSSVDRFRLAARCFAVGGGELVKRIDQPRDSGRRHEPNVRHHYGEQLLCRADGGQLCRCEHAHCGARRTRRPGFGIECQNRGLCRGEEISQRHPHTGNHGFELPKGSRYD